MKKWNESCSVNWWTSRYWSIRKMKRTTNSYKHRVSSIYKEKNEDEKHFRHSSQIVKLRKMHVQCSDHANLIAHTWKIIWRRIGANIWQTFRSQMNLLSIQPNRATLSCGNSCVSQYVLNWCLGNCLIIIMLIIIVGCEILFIILNNILFALERFNDYVFTWN